MIIERLQLRGLLRFTDAIDLDFRPIGPGLVAIWGANGEGKTSILDAMLAAFYRKLPSRAESKLADYAVSRDAFVEVEALVDGRGRYRSRVNLDAVSGKSDAVLSLNGRAINDGKLPAFDAAVALEFPPMSLLLASAFAAQNRNGSFISLEKGERKQLFATLLGLEDLEAKAATARRAATMVDRALVEVRAVVTRIRQVVNPAADEALSTEGNNLFAEALELEAKQSTLTEGLEALERGELEPARQAAAAAAAVATERARLEERVAAIERELAGFLSALTTGESETATATAAARSATALLVASYRRQLAALDTEAELEERLTVALTAIGERLAADRADRQTKLANNRDLLGRALEVRAAASRSKVLEAELVDLDAVEGQAGAARTEAAAANRASMRAARDAAADLERLENHRKRAAWLEGVPCKGQGIYAACQYLGDAVESRKFVDARTADIEAAVAITAEAHRTAEAAERAADAAVDDVRRLIAALETERKALAPTAALLGRLEAAEARVVELEKDLVDLAAAARAEEVKARTASTTLRNTAASSRAALEADITEAEKALEAKLTIITTNAAESVAYLEGRRAEVAKGLDAAVETLKAMAPPDAGAAARLAQLEADLAVYRRESHDIAVALAVCRQRRETFERKRAEYQRQTEELGLAARALETLSTDYVEWSTLGRILGPEGLQVIEIDGAGPGVSALTNDLLEACFGGRFQVELVTQEAKADGKGMKESFELKVYDAERGGEARNLEDLSGGEQVLVDEAVKSAIALFVNQRNVRPIRTCWRDETTGALDADNARRYVDMLRRVQSRGGFHQILFVTHNAEAAALADAKILVGGGAAKIVYPPFAS